MVESQGIGERFAAIRARIQGACFKSGRDGSSVTLIAVTKNVDIDQIQEALAAGIANIGESRVQEAVEKLKGLGDAHPSLRRHFIGTLQRNKAKLVVEHFDCIHSVDSIALLEELEEQAARVKRASPIEIMIQVNISGEASKHGCLEEDTAKILAAASGCKHLRAIGLMTIPPLEKDPQRAKALFSKLRGLRDYLNPGLKLSMGMSGDFEAAIEEGSDFVRIGAGIFGERPTYGKAEDS